jgi:SAM-dependent methyltransferase
MNNLDKQKYIDRYNDRLKSFGYDPRSLGWGEGGRERQNLRFKELIAIQNFLSNSVASILDVGCGFADFFEYLSSNHLPIEYAGIDINPKLLEVAREIHGRNLMVAQCDILDEKQLEANCSIRASDIVVASGIFNFKLDGQDQLSYIEAMLRKMYDMSNYGVAVDFMTTYVDWHAEGAFHMDPAILFKMAKSISSKVIMRHDYLPYEYCIYLIH